MQPTENERREARLSLSTQKERSIQPGLANDRRQGAGFEILVQGDRNGACGIPNAQLHDPMASPLPHFHKSMPLQMTTHFPT